MLRLEATTVADVPVEKAWEFRSDLETFPAELDRVGPVVEAHNRAAN